MNSRDTFGGEINMWLHSCKFYCRVYFRIAVILNSLEQSEIYFMKNYGKMTLTLWSFGELFCEGRDFEESFKRFYQESIEAEYVDPRFA